MLDWLYRALGTMLSFFDSITGSYALALLFYALIFKILFLFFSVKQQKNQIKMAELTPKIELIRAKYKGRTDQVTMQKQQQEIMELQQKEGYNPMSGCLPMLIQLPIIMLLYTVIQNPLSYIATTTPAIDDYNNNYTKEEYVIDADIAEIYGDVLTDDNGKFTKELTRDHIIAKINERYATEDGQVLNEIALIDHILNDISNSDDRENTIKNIEAYGIRYTSIPNFELFGVSLAKTPSFKSFDILVLIPILAAAASWLSMWLTRKMNNTGLQSAQDAQTQASMRIMDLVMPLMTLFIAFNFSAMLGLYWIFQSLLGLLQSFLLSRIMPLPKFTEDEIKEMRRQQKEVEKAQRQAAKLQPKHKSLHYIDEDDYDDLPTVTPSAPEEKKKGGFGSDVPEIKD